MSYSRYKTIARLIQFSSHNIECNHLITSRLYTSDVSFKSKAPHESTLKPKKYFNDYEDVSKEPKQNRHRSNTYRRNYKLRENPIYFEIPEETNTKRETKVLQSTSHESISNKRISSTKPDALPTQKYTFDHELEFDADSKPLNKSVTRTSSFDQDTLALESDKDVQVISREKTIQSHEGPIKLDLSLDEFDINEFLKEFDTSVPKPLDECKEDLSDYGPNFVPTFNFAAYANNSKLIQEYIKLGVNLHKVEVNQDHMRALLTVDLEKQLPVYIQFLHDCGVPANCLGDYITECPMILHEDLDDMKTRIRYLKAHKFQQDSIARIVTKNPFWLTWATKHIDERLGHFQNEFKLSGSEVRFLATKQPKLITYNKKHIHENTFAIREEMGFAKNETKVLLLATPRIWMMSRRKIVDAFNYIHNVMNFSHLKIASHALLLTCRKARIKNRHEFLVELQKVQYDPKKPGYIAPMTLITGSDVDFCRDVAKTSVETYNLFLKTR